jgi:hypothetical protein
MGIRPNGDRNVTEQSIQVMQEGVSSFLLPRLFHRVVILLFGSHQILYGAHLTVLCPFPGILGDRDRPCLTQPMIKLGQDRFKGR